jgi:hypothetical protein
VPGRSDILFHTGNTINDSNGCIIVGAQFGEIAGHRAILYSRATFDRLMLAINDSGVIPLLIREAYL